MHWFPLVMSMAGAFARPAPQCTSHPACTAPTATFHSTRHDPQHPACTACRHFWLGCNHFPPCNLSVSKGVLLFYTVETGFYIQSIHFLLFHEVSIVPHCHQWQEGNLV